MRRFPAVQHVQQQLDPFPAIYTDGEEGVVGTLLAGKFPAARAFAALKPCDTEPLVRFRTVSCRLFVNKTLNSSWLSCGTAFGYPR